MSANNPKQPAEPVQSDREAARPTLWEVLAAHWGLCREHEFDAELVKGTYDKHRYVQAFATHRRDHVRKALEDAAQIAEDNDDFGTAKDIRALIEEPKP